MRVWGDVLSSVGQIILLIFLLVDVVYFGVLDFILLDFR